MRATEGNRRVRTWRKLGGLIFASLLAASLFGGTAQAAQPTWPVGHGTAWQTPLADSGASSSSVAAGSKVGFFEWLHNPGSSNISQLYVNATTSLSVVGAVFTIKADAANGTETTVRGPLPCAPTTTWLCSFGALNAGQTVYLTAAFGTDATLRDGSNVDVRFEFNATGTPPGGNKSHGDFVPLPDSVLISKNADADGNFNWDQATDFHVASAPAGGNNKQSTSLSIGSFLIGASVNDSPSLTPATCNSALVAEIVAANPANSWFNCSLLTSLTSAIQAGNGKTFTDTNGVPLIKVIVSFKNAPSQLTGTHPFVYHVNAAGTDAELITTTCPSGGPTALSGQCLTVGHNLVTVWLAHNGGLRM